MNIRLKNVVLVVQNCGFWRWLLAALPWGVVLLWLLWRFMGGSDPVPMPAVRWQPPAPLVTAENVSRHHWFGMAQPVLPPALQLVGVFAPEDPRAPGSFAVLERDGRVQYLLAGQLAAERWTLAEVRHDGIVLANGSQQQFYPLRTENQSHGMQPPGDEPEALPPPPPGIAGEE
jgi:hypothetical protein